MALETAQSIETPTDALPHIEVDTRLDRIAQALEKHRIIRATIVQATRGVQTQIGYIMFHEIDSKGKEQVVSCASQQEVGQRLGNSDLGTLGPTNSPDDWQNAFNWLSSGETAFFYLPITMYMEGRPSIEDVHTMPRDPIEVKPSPDRFIVRKLLEKPHNPILVELMNDQSKPMVRING